MADVVSTPYSRVWLIENGANPGTVPSYEGLWKAGALTFGQGDVTPIRNPSASRYGGFDISGTIPGEPDLPEIAVTARYLFDLSEMLRLVNIGCTHDLQVHMGQCQNPQNFNGGWDKILVLEQARISNYSTTDLGALEPSENAVVNEDVTWQGQRVYEIKKQTATEVGAVTVTREVFAVAVCDQAGCGGACGTSSDGCQIVFFVTSSSGGSPGLPGDVVYSEDGMSTSGVTQITTLAVDEQPEDAACVGDNLVVVSPDSESLHYAPIADILDDAEAWSEVTSGFVAAKGPKAIFSLSPNETWMVGEGGYVYFTTDPTGSVVVQDAGVATIENLNDIHAISSVDAVAVGANNAVIRTTDGTTWGAKTGPAPGVVLNTVWMKSDLIWLVGSAAGRLYRTNNGGDSWTEVGFTGNGVGAIRDIHFANNTVGFMAHNTAAPAGRILKTVDGGNTWYVAPEQGTLPTNDYVQALIACNQNTVFGGGLAGNGTDGFAVKLS